MRISRRFVAWIRTGVLLTLAAGAGLFLYALKLGFTESLYSRRGTFAFFVTVTEPVIRTFPVLDAISEPEYHSGCGDGPKMPDRSISYRSRLPAADLLPQATRHITAHGYAAITNPGYPGLTFTAVGRTLYLSVKPADDGTTQVDAEVLFDNTN